MNLVSNAAIKLAYQWERAAGDAARAGLKEVQLLALEPILQHSEGNSRALESKLQELHLLLPAPLLLSWLEVLVELSKVHPGVRAMAQAALFEPSLESLARQMHESSWCYRNCALEALDKIQSTDQPIGSQPDVPTLKFDPEIFDQEPPVRPELEHQHDSLFELMIKGFSLPESRRPSH
jgi:hypothetical protein